MATIQMYYKSSSGYQLYYPQTDMQSVINLNSTISGINSTISSNYSTINNKFSNYYTKTQVLSGSTAISYGLPSTATPDQVFQVLNTQSYPKTGDVKITARNNLDSSWALCNGGSLPSISFDKVYVYIKE